MNTKDKHKRNGAAEPKSLQRAPAPAALAKTATPGELSPAMLKSVARMFGVRDESLAAVIVEQANRTRALWSAGDLGDDLETALTMLLELEPRTMTEALLGVQMVGVHHAGLALLRRAALQQSSESASADLGHASALMRLYIEQLDAMAKLKGKTGQQKVTVEHVHVHEGGQAIVGAVSTETSKRRGGVVEKRGRKPHEPRRGWLRNGNPPGDLSKAPRCGAKTRRGTSCQCPAMANGRCRLHGGLSTGPKTEDGIERIRRAVTKHGRYSNANREQRRNVRELMKQARALLNAIR